MYSNISVPLDAAMNIDTEWSFFEGFHLTMAGEFKGECSYAVEEEKITCSGKFEKVTVEFPLPVRNVPGFDVQYEPSNREAFTMVDTGIGNWFETAIDPHRAGAYKLVKTMPALRGAPDWALATAVGTAVAAVAGYLVIDWLLGWLRTRTTYLFVAWRIVAGVLVAALILGGVLPEHEAPPAPAPAAGARLP